MSPLTAERVLIFGALYFISYSPWVSSPADMLPEDDCTNSRVDRQARIGPKIQPGRRVFLPLPTKRPPDPVAGEADHPAQLQSH